MNKFRWMWIVAFVMIFSITGAAIAQAPETITLSVPTLEKGKTLMKALQERRSNRDFLDKQLSAEDLSNVLWCANGVNRPETGNRTSPSARNKQDIDVFAIMKDGAYLYLPKKNQLVLVAAGDFRKDAGVQPFVAVAPVNLIYVSDLSKFDFIKEREEIVMTAAIDAGHCSQNVYLYGSSAGLSVVTRTSVDGKKLAGILKLKPRQFVIMGQTIGYPK
jgi:SagB-type dehydrogenase family enzyme